MRFDGAAVFAYTLLVLLLLLLLLLLLNVAVALPITQDWQAEFVHVSAGFRRVEVLPFSWISASKGFVSH